MKGVDLPFEPVGHCCLSTVAGVKYVGDLTDKHQAYIVALPAGMAAAQKTTETINVVMNALLKIGIVVVFFESSDDTAAFQAAWEMMRQESLAAELAAAPAGKLPTHFHNVRQ